MPEGKETQTVPKHLQAATRAWYIDVTESYELEPHHLRLLQLAAEAWDRCQEARAVLSKSGLTYEDRFGAPRARPEVAVERDSRLAFARLVRELGLDLTEPPDTRPPFTQGRRQQ